jgi:hypothetical protein
VQSCERTLQEFRFYDEAGRPTTIDYDPTFNELVTEFEHEMDEHVQNIEDYSLPKPDWFIEGEQQARSFWNKLGFYALSPIHIVAEKHIITEPVKVGEIDVYSLAECLPFIRLIQFNKELLEKNYKANPQLVGRFIAHEFAHDIADRPSLGHVRKEKNGEISLALRHGFGVLDKDGNQRNIFLEEAFATFMAGWHERSAQEPHAQPVSIKDAPFKELPSHYAGGTTVFAGYDGWALETLTWAIEQRCIMPATTFVKGLLEARGGSKQLPALRQTAQAIERLRPGLYMALNHLQYELEDWQKGFDMIYEAATAN